jgi:hypothetical protein
MARDTASVSPRDEVDSLRLSTLVRDAGSTLDRDAAAAAELAHAALALSDGLAEATCHRRPGTCRTS